MFKKNINKECFLNRESSTQQLRKNEKQKKCSCFYHRNYEVFHYTSELFNYALLFMLIGIFLFLFQMG